MDIIIEIIGELISGLFEWLLESEKVPKGLRIGLLCLLEGAVIGIFILVAVAANNIFVTLLMLALSALLVFFTVRKIRKIKNK